jgi:hypothetical protein
VRWRKPVRWIALSFATSVGCLVVAAAAWGLPGFSTSPKAAAGDGAQAELFDVATGCHPTFDRFVIRARFAIPGYDVRYVGQVVADPSGRRVPLLGPRYIRVVIRQARGRTASGSNLLPAVITPLCPALQQVKQTGDFEGVVSYGLGVRRQAGFRVFRLTGPTRIVIDVAH